MKERAVARDQGRECVDVRDHGADLSRHAVVPKLALRLEESTPRLAETLEGGLPSARNLAAAPTSTSWRKITCSAGSIWS